MKRSRVFHIFQAYLFLLPAAAIMLVFLYYPLVTSIEYSFFSFKNFVPFKFIGLQNYQYAFSDVIFVNSLYLTFKWVIMNAFLPTFAGLILAMLLEYFTRSLWFTSAARTILFMPMMMSMVAVGLLWTLIYDPNLGIINGIISGLGGTEKFVPYSNLSTALYVAFIPMIWQSSGFSMVIFSAALQGVSKEMLESSMIEGANKFNQVRYIMIPSIIKTISMVVIVNMISGFKAFDLLYVLTRGGPGMSTEITAVYAYIQAFFSFKFEYASTMMVCLLLCVIIFLAVFSFITGKIEKRFGA